MGLRLKFNIVLALVFAAGMAVSAWVSHELLQRNATHEVLRNAGLMMDTALSVRGYTVSQVKPLLESQLAETFLPQAVSAYAATETFNSLRKKYPDYTYKEATLNPTNPRDRALEWEADVVNAFRNTATLPELSGERDTPAGRMLYLARPIQIKDPACLACHSVPSAAPASMIKLYGENNGFGWKHQEIIGAQVVSVPMALPIKNANDAFMVFMGSLAAIFVVTFIVLNLMLSLMILRPITRMSAAADKISQGDFDVPEFGKSRDEIGMLGTSFNRMRRSLQKALKLIER
ncbi:MAG: c-type heme family protein [Usitatibacter sp.]